MLVEQGDMTGRRDRRNEMLVGKVKLNGWVTSNITPPPILMEPGPLRRISARAES